MCSSWRLSAQEGIKYFGLILGHIIELPAIQTANHRSDGTEMAVRIQESSRRTRMLSCLFNGCKQNHALQWVYRRSPFLQWLRDLPARRHWRELHTRHSCVYGASLRPFLVDMLRTSLSLRRCDGCTVEHFESCLRSVLGAGHLVTFSSGRNSLRAILKAMRFGEGDEVITPGFTCAVVPYTILHCGARPVYVDIQSDYRMNLEALRASLTPKTKAIIAQHTFGLPERMSDILTLARARGIRIIEDCTHVLPGSKYAGKPLGTWGDAAYFSFEGGKTISSGSGGAAVTSDESIGRLLHQLKDSVPPLSRTDNMRIGARLLLYIVLFHPSLFALGELIRGKAYRKGLLSRAVPPSECRGDPPRQLLGRLADIQATLLLSQIQRLSSITDQRRSCVSALAKGLGVSTIDLPLMWYPLQVTNREEAVGYFSNNQIELRTWETPLTPSDCDTVRAGYHWGSCPVAEEISRGCVALPTMLEKADLERVIEVASRHLDIVRTE
jgi:perosamine synthetase